MTTDLTLHERREQLKNAEFAKLASLYRCLNGLDGPRQATSGLTCRDFIDYLIVHEGLGNRLSVSGPSN